MTNFMTNFDRSSPRAPRLASLEDVKRFLSESPGGLLLDVLSAECHARMRLPGSTQACVFETSFAARVEQLAPDPETPIMVYGAGASLDAAVATAKLLGQGYRNVRMWPGGIRMWRLAGLPLEGEAADRPLSAERDDLGCGDVEEDLAGSYELSPLDGDIRWTGRSAHAEHHGHLFLKSGSLRFAEGPNGPEASGDVVADMCSMANEDLAGSPLQRELLAHLASEDFFHCALYPEARLTIRRLFPLPGRGASSGEPTHVLRGEAVIRGRAEPLDAPALLRGSGGELVLSLRADIDRTRWGVLYGSARFFRCLGRHEVDDMVSLEARLVFRRGAA